MRLRARAGGNRWASPQHRTPNPLRGASARPAAKEQHTEQG